MFLKAIYTGLAVSTLALAQTGGGGGGGAIGGAGKETGGVPPGGGGGMRVAAKSKGELMVDRLKLNKEQTSEVETILNSTMKDAVPLVQDISKARAAYATALINGTSEADLAPIAKAVADAQFQMTGVEVRAFQKIVALLKPNQLAKAPEAFDVMGGIFQPQGSGMGRGMGRGGMGRGGGR
jgi:hypothetical protein